MTNIMLLGFSSYHSRFPPHSRFLAALVNNPFCRGPRPHHPPLCFTFLWQGAALNLHAIRDRTWRLVPCSAVTTVGTSPPLCMSPVVIRFVLGVHSLSPHFLSPCMWYGHLPFVRGALGHPVHRASRQSRPGSEKHQRQRHWCCRGGDGDGDSGRACRAMTVAVTPCLARCLLHVLRSICFAMI